MPSPLGYGFQQSLFTHVVRFAYRYFKDQTLLDKVPYVFLLTGGVYTGLQAVAIAGMLRKPVPKAGSTDSQDDGLELQAGEGTWLLYVGS